MKGHDQLFEYLRPFYEIHMEEYIGHCNYTYIYKPEYSVDKFLQINLE